jgi:hypothetical protein
MNLHSDLRLEYVPLTSFSRPDNSIADWSFPGAYLTPNGSSIGSNRVKRVARRRKELIIQSGPGRARLGSLQ